jgi:hypothetical protein
MGFYFLKPNGTYKGMTVGDILNADGTVYTRNMKNDTHPEEQTLNIAQPIVAADKCRVKVSGDIYSQKVDLFFVQEIDGQEVVVAAVRYNSVEEARKLKEEIESGIAKLGIIQFDYEKRAKDNGEARRL